MTNETLKLLSVETFKATFNKVLKPGLQLTTQKISTNFPIFFKKFGGKRPVEQMKKIKRNHLKLYEFADRKSVDG